MLRVKIPWGTIVVGAVFMLVIGYYIGAACYPGGTVFTWYTEIQKVLDNPFQNYFGQYTLVSVLITEAVYAFAMFYWVVTQKNYMSGREFDSSRLADPKTISRRLADRETSPDCPYILLVRNEQRRRNKWWKNR